jgi:hypothetical protein
MGPVATYRVNKHKESKTEVTSDSRQRIGGWGTGGGDEIWLRGPVGGWNGGGLDV